MSYICLAAQVGSVICGLIAAYFWYQSTKVLTPEKFSIQVTKPDQMPLGGSPLGGTYAGSGHSDELTKLGEALREQSRLNARAAIFTAISVILLMVHAY